MKANLAFLFLLLPALCFAQNRKFDKDYSRYELNFNVSSNSSINDSREGIFNNAGLSIYGTYAIEEDFKPGAGIQMNYDGGFYSIALPLSITLTGAANKTNTYARFETGPLMPLISGAKLGFTYNFALGFQYEVSKSAGVNVEGFYKRIGYGRTPQLIYEYVAPFEGFTYYSPSYYSVNCIGFSLGLNFRLKK